MRGLDAHIKAFEKGAYIRVAGDIIALAPPLIIRREEIDQLFEIVRGVLKTTN
jgi:beta-alanine--pyruvate transaminase